MVNAVHRRCAFAWLCTFARFAVVATFIAVIARVAAEPYAPATTSRFDEPWRWSEIDVLRETIVRQADSDARGHLWLGSRGGVLEYDGYQTVLHAFPAPPGGEAAEVRSLHVARDGSLYVLADGAALRFHDGTWTRLFATQPDSGGGTRIAEAPDGAVWFATRDGLYRVHRNEIRPVELEGDDRFSGCLVDGSNRLWVANAPSGTVLIYRLSPATGLPEGEPRRIVTALRSAGGNAKLEMHVGPTGRIWLASAGSEVDGLRVMENDVLRTVRRSLLDLGFSSRPGIAECRDGTLFLSSQGVVVQFDGEHWTAHRGDGPNVPAGNPFLRVLPGDLLVMGARMEKTFVIDLSTRRWETLPGLLFQCEDAAGNAWFLDAAHQIVQRDRHTGEWSRVPRGEQAIDTPNSIIAGPDDTLWASGSHGGVAAVAWWRAGRWTRQIHPELGALISHVSAVQTADGTLYFGSGRPLGRDRPGGLVRYRVKAGGVESRVLPPPQYPARPVGIAEAADGTLFFGGAGLSSKPSGYELTPPAPPIEGNWIDHVVASPDGQVWLAVSGWGAYRLTAGKWTRFAEQDGLAGNSAVASLSGRHAAGYWLATGEGLSRFDGRAWTRVALAPEFHFRRESGTLREMADGSLWMNFGTRAWFFNQSPAHADREAFRTVRHTPDRRPPQTRMLAFDARGQEDGNLLFTWEGADFWAQTGPAQLEFSWRVDGGEWSPFSVRRDVLLNRVATGAHRFEVRARDRDWNIDPAPASVAFEIVPFLWKRPWFIATVFATVATLIALVVLLVRTRIRHLREMEKFKLQFFTNLSHELRNPLAVVLGPLESLLRQPADGATRSRLEIAYRNARKLGRLVDQLLEFRSAQAGTAPFRPVRADVTVHLREAVEGLRPLWEEKRHRVALVLPRTGEAVGFDPAKLGHIVENLLSNAIKYTPAGGAIEVAARILAPSGAGAGNATLELAVTDNGCGVAREHHALVFQPFFRGSAQPAAGKGFGIGLAFTGELVRACGGTIDLVSPVPETRVGTRFTVRLPLVGDAAAIVSPEAPQPGIPEVRFTAATEPGRSEPSDAHDSAKRPRILLIDDHEDVRTYLRGELADRYEVTEARDGREGLDAAVRSGPEVIITDLAMPDIDGIELCRRLKSSAETSHIPIMLLTARRADELRAQGLGAGADDYFTKPVDFRLLATRIENLLESRRILRERFTRQIVVQPAEITVTSTDQLFLERAVAIVGEHMRDETFDVEEFARRIGMSRVTLFRKIKGVTGQTPTHFVRSLRLKRAAQLLRTSDLNVSEILEHVGILDLSYFSRIFRQEFGQTPTQYRQEAAQAN
jgi:signal transduction histidine kinase/DNA-binding response OmpR family regulator